MMITEEREIAEEFVKLPYKKKVCFVPFETKENALIYVEFGDKLKGVPFWKIVNGMAMGTYPYYDVFELIQNAQLKKIVEV